MTKSQQAMHLVRSESCSSVPFDERDSCRVSQSHHEYSPKTDADLPPTGRTTTRLRKRQCQNDTAILHASTAIPSTYSPHPRGGNNNSAEGSIIRKPPSLRAICSVGLDTLMLCLCRCNDTLKIPCRRIRKCAMAALACVLLLGVWVVKGFYVDATRVCQIPLSSMEQTSDQRRPLVEYYVHGRGNGHYARSVAIIDDLNRAGVDVRMFIGRATMWNAFHESKATNDQQQQQQQQQQPKGTTTAIAVTSLMPSLNFWSTISTALERIMGDCDVALQTGRYPLLVIADGDVPGVLRAKLGGVPSVGISHGQIFNIAPAPKWVLENSKLHQAWKQEGRLNGRSALFTNWQIATSFLSMETRFPTAVVARAPLRPEVLQIGLDRAKLKQGREVALSHFKWLSSNANDRNYTAQEKRKNEKDAALVEFLSLRQSHPRNQYQHQSEAVLLQSAHNYIPRRKVILCYFRDGNGEAVIQSLLQAGFDIIHFEKPGYRKESFKEQDPVQSKWIVDRGEDKDQLMQYFVELSKRNAETKTSTAEYSQKKHIKPKLPPKKKDTNAIKAETKDRNRRRRLKGLEEILPSTNLIRVTDHSLFIPLMSIVDGAVSSAGSQFMSECIYMDMPLLAMYKEEDSEQRLNVEMSRHRNHRDKENQKVKTQVYGMSFEEFHAGFGGGGDEAHSSSLLRGRKGRSTATLSTTSREFHDFVMTVQESIVSRSYFASLENRNSTNDVTAQKEILDTTPSPNPLVDDRFRGMPDASAVILKIIKQVQNSD